MNPLIAILGTGAALVSFVLGSYVGSTSGSPRQPAGLSLTCTTVQGDQPHLMPQAVDAIWNAFPADLQDADARLGIETMIPMLCNQGMYQTMGQIATELAPAFRNERAGH